MVKVIVIIIATMMMMMMMMLLLLFLLFYGPSDTSTLPFISVHIIVTTEMDNLTMFI